MKLSVMPSNNDLNYYLSRDYAETARIVAGMTSIIDVNEDKLLVMQNQNWFQRMWFTVSGKNKATIQEMEQNRDKLAAYTVQVFAKFIEEKRISDAIISNITIRLNEIYSSHLQLQEIMYEFVNKLNEKIDSVNTYQNLITDIQNNKYDPKKNFVSLLEILSLLDKRTTSDNKDLIRIKETMETNGFVFAQTVSIGAFTEQILALPEESIGQVYLFAQNHTKFKFIQFACCLIEKYHFEPKSHRKIIKDNVVKISLRNCGLTGNEDCNVDEFYDDIQSDAIDKFAMCREFSTPEYTSEQDSAVDDNRKAEQPFDSSEVSEKTNTDIAIVYDKNTKQCAEFLLGLIGEVVKEGEGKMSAVLYPEKIFAKLPPENKSVNQKIIYIGNFPESEMLSKNILKWQFDQFGFRYGWLGYKSVILFDEKKISEAAFGDMKEYAKNKFKKYVDILNSVEDGGFWNSLTTKEKIGVGVGGTVAAAVLALLVFASDSDTDDMII
ncbi:hypothetical protein [Sporomusa aerivorans]|uniref:hypothetical protein n=1 Tax=Sporomusa aerivorans TaxID=204936 RepID=UPI00352B15C6